MNVGASVVDFWVFLWVLSSFLAACVSLRRRLLDRLLGRIPDAPKSGTRTHEVSLELPFGANDPADEPRESALSSSISHWTQRTQYAFRVAAGNEVRFHTVDTVGVDIEFLQSYV